MWKKITDSKSFYVVLSLLLAFVLWLYVGSEANPESTDTIRNIRLTVSGLERLEERGLMIAQGAEQAITLTLQAKRDVWAKLDSDNITVTVDVSNITEPGTVSLDYRISYPMSVLGEVITERDKRPEKVELTISRLTRKDVEVRFSFDGSVAEDYQLGEYSLAPQSITVQGRQEVIDQVSHALVTVSAQGMDETYSQETPFVLMGFNGEPLPAAAAAEVETAETTILTTVPVVKLKEIPLSVELVPGGGATEEDVKVDIEPGSIMVSGDEDDLEALKEIKLDPIELYNIYSTNTLVRTVNLAPELTNVSGVAEATVTVTIQGLYDRVLVADNIEIINVPEGYTADPVTLTREISIRGPSQEAVDAVRASQLRVVADLKDVNVILGTQIVPVKVYLDGSSDVGVVGNYNISVSIGQE